MSMIEINHLTFAYEGNYDNVFEDLTLRLDTSWRLGLVGRNGRGKTTLLRLLAGELSGGRAVRTGVSARYFPAPVRRPDRMTLEVLGELCPAAEDWEIIRELSLLDVEIEALYRPFSSLSGGEQTRALLSVLFLADVYKRQAGPPAPGCGSHENIWRAPRHRSAPPAPGSRPPSRRTRSGAPAPWR